MPSARFRRLGPNGFFGGSRKSSVTGYTVGKLNVCPVFMVVGRNRGTRPMEIPVACIRVCVLGNVKLEIDGVPVRLTPLTARLLVRLVAADGKTLPVGTLRHDIWNIDDAPRDARRGRNEVQKRVLELRRAFDCARAGEGSRLLTTERLFTGRTPESAYRLVLEPPQLDCAEFTTLVNQALQEPPVSAAQKLTRAVALWNGPPLAEAGGAHYAVPIVRRLTDMYQSARHELIRIHAELGRLDVALPIAERLAEECPDDPDAGQTLAALREQVRHARGGEILRREFPGLRTTVAVVKGDLFEQEDANLVVGFTDTFDTFTRQDVVISSTSVQGQLVARVFGGQVEELDTLLRRGLRQVAPVTQESRTAKPQGKRTRYPLGTVAALPLDGRRIFATAYSQLGNDLVARSTAETLRESLGKLWDAVALHGQYRPVAVPLIGSGLARIRELSREQLITMIIDTFVHSCRKHTAVASQLRIILRQTELESTQMSDVARFLESFDDDGFAPGNSTRK